ncbi:hypothetical protein BESB_004560 [Besnoitia besnoiti]|uniref:Leucine rich repeat-containing protein n=1 Tax=Besnoitia besnoiti TaxID=94643 RepID=A0A2A9MJG7_BESBE|nr:hypothetical protein BESB_004560 [Besnoitia besnoiti]PFH38115.1 hypothetical protein BESB_004560 [Besnoitia besnoiti]
MTTQNIFGGSGRERRGSSAAPSTLNESKAGHRKELDSYGPVMNRALLGQICKESGQYESPALNDKLYLHFRGFTKIENLDDYTQVRALWLEGNGIRRIEGLDNLKELKCLFLQQNCIREIENLDYCERLVTLDLSHNCIRKIAGLSCLPRLSNLKLAYNAFETLEDIAGLTECPALTNLDISHNNIDFGPQDKRVSADSTLPHSARSTTAARLHASSSPQILHGSPRAGARSLAGEPECVCDADEKATITDWLDDFFALMQRLSGLTCLYFHGNPVIRKLPYYRKRVVAALPGLRYLDDRPIKPVERAGSEAWVTGGRHAEAAAIKRIKETEQQQLSSDLEEFRRMQNRYRENVRRALDRIAREEERRAQAAAGIGKAVLPLWIWQREGEGDLNRLIYGVILFMRDHTADSLGDFAEAQAWTEDEQRREIQRADAVRQSWLRAADSEQQTIAAPRGAGLSTSGRRDETRESVAGASASERPASELAPFTHSQKISFAGNSLLEADREGPTSAGISTDANEFATGADEAGQATDTTVIVDPSVEALLALASESEDTVSSDHLMPATEAQQESHALSGQAAGIASNEEEHTDCPEKTSGVEVPSDVSSIKSLEARYAAIGSVVNCEDTLPAAGSLDARQHGKHEFCFDMLD